MVSDVKILPAENFSGQFIPTEYLPKGKDEYYLRNQQVGKPANYWRKLRADEIATLTAGGVTSEDWQNVLVRDPFQPELLRNCRLCGLVRIGRLENVVLEHHDLRAPAGITDSLIISCDIGDNCAIHNVRYLAHYIVGDHVMLLNLGEMHTTNHAKFGNGIIKDGESEQVRLWLEVMNENGGRAVMPFDGMIATDAYLWAKYRDDAELLAKLRELTQRQFDSRRGLYGTVGDACVIKNSQIIKDVKIGAGCYIKGANKLKNLTINSSPLEPTQIGEGVELVNGIIGAGCRVFYGCKAVRFVLGNNASLKYGARLIHSLLGDNSTISCCEVLNSLIFPAHEQHHNSSFLVAALVMGQSNIAAGATLGSNHNSRANDGEIEAGRGFWPGLCTTVKHCSRFASFTLLAQGSYTAELDIPLPFALVSNDMADDRLLVAPAFWWQYSMFALQRNTWKFQTRDTRTTKTQHIEYDFLAPDTAEEIFHAMRLLEIWTAKAQLRGTGRTGEGQDDDALAARGRDLLHAADAETAGLEILGENMENSHREVVILKARQGYHAYRQMLHYYAVRSLLDFFKADPRATLASLCVWLVGPRETNWANLGGQLVRMSDLDQLRTDVKSGELRSWPDIHQAYDALWTAYPRHRQQHAYACLLELLAAAELTPNLWTAALDEAVRIQRYVAEQVFLTRAKDYRNPFRQSTFRNADEMRAVFGNLEDNSFVKLVRQETQVFEELVEAVKRRG